MAERADVELRTLFGYGVGEGVLQRFEGVEMRKVRLWLAGTCYLSQNYLSFHGRMFGLEKKTVWLTVDRRVARLSHRCSASH